MLDKNPEQKILKLIQNDVYNLIYCKYAFSKQVFFEKLIENTKIPIIYLDFDLLYSGYVKMGIYPMHEKLQIYQIDNNLSSVIAKVTQTISKEKFLVIVDSLNGFYNCLADKDAGRVINSYLMLLVTAAEQSDSKVVVGCMARKKENEELVLLPSSRHVMTLKKMHTIFLKTDDSKITANSLDDDLSVKSTTVI